MLPYLGMGSILLAGDTKIINVSLVSDKTRKTERHSFSLSWMVLVGQLNAGTGVG